LTIEDEDLERLQAIARSRTEPASRVERARMLLAYCDDPSFFAVGRALGVHHQTVQRCVERAVAYGALAALDDRPRPGKEPTITAEAKAWLVSLACRKAKELGYPHEVWTTRLLARHAREHGPAAGHECLANLVQGTVCKILAQPEALNRSMERRVLVQGTMSPRLITVGSIRAYDSAQVRFTEHDHVVQAFPTDRSLNGITVS
jgi:transposase